MSTDRTEALREYILAAGDDLNPRSPLNVANIILAELPDQDPTRVAQIAKDIASARWHQFAVAVRRDNEQFIRTDIWDEQVQDVIEFYAAWVPTAPESYPRDRARLMRLLAGRKNCRDFLPANGRAGVPKSSLDGLRESVLREPRAARASLRLADGEQLDMVAFVKRKGEGARPYPSVARVAADPWLRGVGPASLADVRAACQNMASVRRGSPVYSDFPFEGTVVYTGRHCDLVDEGAATEEQIAALRKALGKIDGEPSPYLAVVVADGDSMGPRLSELSSAEDHRVFSRRLADFAAQANQILEQHRGVLVYSGGDDVLAFVPVDQALLCARALHTTFHDRTRMTLSVGIAIAHFMEPLEDLLAYGRAAEKDAKGVDGKDALAVHLHKRGGGPVKVRGKWVQPDGLDARLIKWANHLNAGALPTRVATNLHEIARVYDNWSDDNLASAIQRDTTSIMKGKRGERSAMQWLEQLIGKVCDAGSLRRLADELLVARQLARSLRQASGQGEAQP